MHIFSGLLNTHKLQIKVLRLEPQTVGTKHFSSYFFSQLFQNKFIHADAEYRHFSHVLFSLAIFQFYIFTWSLRYCWKKCAFLVHYNPDLDGLFVCHLDMYDSNTSNCDFIYFSAISYKYDGKIITSYFFYFWLCKVAGKTEIHTQLWSWNDQ